MERSQPRAAVRLRSGELAAWTIGQRTHDYAKNDEGNKHRHSPDALMRHEEALDEHGTLSYGYAVGC